MLYTLLVILYVIVCLFLIVVVLLQTGKRADLAGAFGGGGSQTAFGARGAATFLSRMTTWSPSCSWSTRWSSRLIGLGGRRPSIGRARRPMSSAPGAVPGPAQTPPAHDCRRRPGDPAARRRLCDVPRRQDVSRAEVVELVDTPS